MKLSTVAIVGSFLVGSAAAFAPVQPSHSVGAASTFSHSSTTTSLNMALDDPAAYAKDLIDKNDVMVFSKSYCPYCEQTKTVFEKMDGVNANIVELDLNEDGSAIQDALLEITGQKTVPNVFVKGNHIGGNDDTQLAAKMGKIKKMLAE